MQDHVTMDHRNLPTNQKYARSLSAVLILWLDEKDTSQDIARKLMQTKPQLVKPIGAKFKNLEKSLRWNRCEQKLKSVNGRKAHEARYCGKLKARANKSFSSSVKDASGTRFESVHTFKFLRQFTGPVMQKKLSVNWLKVDNASEHLEKQTISDSIEKQALQSVHLDSGVVQLRDTDDKQSVGENT